MERPSANILISYFKGQCQPHEIELVELYLAMDIDQEHVANCMQAAWLGDLESSGQILSEAELADFKARFSVQQSKIEQLQPLKDGQSDRKPIFRLPTWVKAAAAVLILTGTALLLYNYASHRKSSELALNEDIPPGGEKALLTLADGSVVSLSDQPSGNLALQDGLKVEKTKEGEIVYTLAKKATETSTAVNAIATPRGGQYQVTLPDGTKAWLNAASSLRYPLRFGKERKVKMTGEVYFEVAKVVEKSTGKRIPFWVETDRQQVQVLGTHFNVNAYKDEPNVKTTLLEGSVKVTAHNGQSAHLKPGELAVLSATLVVQKADVDQELAWKNGDFIFKAETLESALRQISRWYNVAIECPERLGKLRFNGMISRKQPLSTIIEMIQLTKMAKVTVKERRLIVTD